MSDRSHPDQERLDLFQRIERALRTPRRRLLLDAFLPPPESIASAIPPPEPVVSEIPASQQGFVQQLREQEPEKPLEPPRPQIRRRRVETEPPATKTLQEEIDEFMNRDGAAALAPDPDPTD